MSASESLKQFLKEKKERRETGAGWTARRQEKLRVIASLYADVEGWLRPSLAEELMTVLREPWPLDGSIEAEALVLKVAEDRVELRPVLADVAGGVARVDMRSGGRSITLVYLPDQGWHFIVRKVRVARGVEARAETVPVHEESFSDALKELLGE
jgi:hypothetical protein